MAVIILFIICVKLVTDLFSNFNCRAETVKSDCHFTRNLHKMNGSPAVYRGGLEQVSVEVNDILIVQHSVFISVAIIVLIQRN